MTQIIECSSNERKPSTIVDLEAVKARQQIMWASGDFAVIGTTLQIVGETLCEALDVDSGSRVLDVAWGTPAADVSSRSQGTFKEVWALVWHPEFDVRLIEAGAWGTTVHGAATTRIQAEAADAPGLPELTALAERALLAGLDEALPAVMSALADRATADGDTVRLMEALPPLVRALRYGDVRGTPTGPLRTVVDVALADYPLLWAAGGHPHAVFPLSYDELVRITSGTELAVARDTRD